MEAERKRAEQKYEALLAVRTVLEKRVAPGLETKYREPLSDALKHLEELRCKMATDLGFRVS
jgi:hypothetical protein